MTRARVPGRCLVIGLGNEHRRDDGAGPAVAARLGGLLPGATVLTPLADPLEMLGRWDDAPLAVVIDAVSSGAAPGTVHVVELEMAGPAGTGAGVTSTHGMGLPEVCRLAGVTGRAPQRVVVVGIEGSDFGHGTGLTPDVEQAVDGAARRVAELVQQRS